MLRAIRFKRSSQSTAVLRFGLLPYHCGSDELSGRILLKTINMIVVGLGGEVRLLVVVEQAPQRRTGDSGRLSDGRSTYPYRLSGVAR